MAAGFFIVRYFRLPWMILQMLSRWSSAPPHARAIPFLRER